MSELRVQIKHLIQYLKGSYGLALVGDLEDVELLDLRQGVEVHQRNLDKLLVLIAKSKKMMRVVGSYLFLHSSPRLLGYIKEHLVYQDAALGPWYGDKSDDEIYFLGWINDDHADEEEAASAAASAARAELMESAQVLRVVNPERYSEFVKENNLCTGFSFGFDDPYLPEAVTQPTTSVNGLIKNFEAMSMDDPYVPFHESDESDEDDEEQGFDDEAEQDHFVKKKRKTN
jgi:hypothetical protein